MLLHPLLPAVLPAQTPQSAVNAAAFPASPQELFASVAGDVRPQWRACFAGRPREAPADRSRAALALGASLADCYLAAEARDAQQLRNHLMDLDGIEKTLGLHRAAGGGRQKLNDLAAAGDWPALREAIDGLHGLHSRTLKANMDEPLIEVESLGLWLRTLHIATHHAAKLPPARCCVWSPAFVTSLHRRAAAAAAADPKSAALQSLTEGLRRLDTLWAAPDAAAEQRTAATLEIIAPLSASLLGGGAP